MKRLLLCMSPGLLLDGLCELIQGTTGFQVIGKVSDLLQLAELDSRQIPDYQIISSELLHSSSVCRKLTHRFRKSYEACGKIVILIDRNDEILLEHFNSFGFSGFIFERSDFSESIQSLLAMDNGAVYLPSFVAERQSRGSYGQIPRKSLTPREKEVLQLISMGESSKEIASDLGIAPSTVDVYRKRLFTKLQVSSVAELTKYAVRTGLTAL